MASPRQRRKVRRVMHEYEHGQLMSGRRRRGKGKKPNVKSRRPAIAIAMSESGQSRKRRGGRKASASNGRKRSAGRRKASTRSASSRSTARRTATRRRKKSAARGRKKSAR